MTLTQINTVYFSMDSLIQFIKHILGLCGESHPNIFMGGFVVYCTYCFNKLFKIKRK